MKGDYNRLLFKHQFDAVWASHVLEHQLNVNLFIKKLFLDCKEDGVVAITVPPIKKQIVGGHLSLWNAGLLMYNIVVALYDCSQCEILRYGYNISIIIRKKTIKNFPVLSFDKGDIRLLSNYFPDNISEPFEGDIKELNWFA